MANRAPWRRWLTRSVVRPLEAGLTKILFGSFGMMPIDTASAIGGAVARTLGPRLRISNRARRNLRRAFPDLPETQIETLVREMWDNLGRIAAEYPHLPHIGERVIFEGAENIERALARGRPLIFFGAHMGNWEITPSLPARHGAPIHLLYRPANNPWVDELIGRMRLGSGAAGLIPKGKEGARLAIQTLAKGENLGLLIDQKLNEGEPIPFFGHDAMTATAIASLAFKFDCALLPSQIERIEGAHFRLTIHPALELPCTGDRQADTRALLTTINRMIEDWIRQRPGQWLWLHQRWSD
ncbi:MAG TPA: lysophospholipid acyltransferase family protein [Alphaproteobacteria bacterium]